MQRMRAQEQPLDQAALHSVKPDGRDIASQPVTRKPTGRRKFYPRRLGSMTVRKRRRQRVGKSGDRESQQWTEDP